MIEAISSALANAKLVRGNVDQNAVAGASNVAGNLQNLEKAQVQLAPYVSLFIQVDNNFNKAVLQIRDSETGDVQNQFPSETTLRARAAQAEIETQAIRDSVRSPEISESSQSSAPVRLANDVNTEAPAQSGGSTRFAESQIASAAFSAQSLAQSGQSSSSVSVFA